MTETQVHSQTLPVGERLEDYRITAVLGQGGFGITYKATEETLRRDVAIKEYLPQQFAFRDGTGQVHPRSQKDEELFRWGLMRFLDEARALAMFKHPNIVSVMRFFERNNTAYLVMEFEEGMDLKGWLRGRDRPDEERLVHGILAPLLQGLARVHDKGLLHRDIKPDNIFIRRDGTPVLIDFGASRPHGPESTSQLTSIISAGYSPFEQYGTGGQQGPWSDLYALAGTMYRVIAGEPPVDAIARAQGTPLTPAVEVGRGRYGSRLLKALDKALSMDIAARPQNAREFLTLLGIEPPPLPADQAATVLLGADARSPALAARRRGREAAALAALAGAAVIAAAGYWWLSAAPGSFPADPVAQNVPAAVPEAPGPTVEPRREASDGPADQVSPAEPPTETAAATDAQQPRADQSEADQSARDQSGTVQPDPVQPGSEPSGAARADVATDQPATEAPGADGAEPAEAPSEDAIVAGLGLPAEVQSYRSNQLTGALLAYTTIRSRFDACQASGCGELPALVEQLGTTMAPQSWRRGAAQGSIAIENPRRTDNEACPYLITIRERLSVGGLTREQGRTYCTSNAIDRIVQDAGPIT